MKSIAGQSVAELGGPASVLSRQKRDHIKLDGLLHQLCAARGDEQAWLLLNTYRLVFPHAFAEEAVLWPVMRRVLPNGHELTLRVEIEHQQINELVTGLEAMDHASPERRQVLDRIVSLLRQDVRDEEDLLLPRLQEALSAAQLRRLGFAWEIVRRIAPTRAHPIVARRPPGNILAALPLALLDRCRDAVDALRIGAAGPAAGPLRALGSTLDGVSHAVERLPGMRSGEDPATRIGRSSTAAVPAAVVAAAAALALIRRRRRA